LQLVGLIRNADFGQVTGAAKQLWSWWLTELRACIPAAASNFFSGAADYLAVWPTDNGFDFIGPGVEHARPALAPDGTRPSRALLDCLQRADQTILFLPQSAALRRIVELPAAAGGDLAAAVPFLIERHTPFRVQDACYAWRRRGRGRARAQAISIELVVVSRRTVAELKAKLETCGLCVNAIRVRGDAGQPALELERVSSGLAKAWRREAALKMAVAAIIILLAGPSLVAAVTHAKLVRLQSDVASSGAHRADLSRLNRQFATAEATLRFFQEKLRPPRRIEVLRDVTEALPDDSWLFNFDADKTSLRLAGFSRNVPTLLRHLRALPWVAAVDFRSPVLHDAAQQADRFDIGLEIASAQYAPAATH
jgi:general secretion pathway protein L